MAEQPPAMFEIAPREDTRFPMSGRPVRPWRTLLMLLPAGVLLVLVLVLPLVATIVTSLTVPGAGLSLGNYRTIWQDEQVRTAIVNSGRWVLVVAPLVCVVGYVIALLWRNARRSRALLIGVIAAPIAVSALVSGMAFRLMFDPQPERGTVTALVSWVEDRLGDPAPLPGARPESGGLLRVDSGSGDLVARDQVEPGQPVELGVQGVPMPPAARPAAPPPAGPDEVAGVLTVDGAPLPGVRVVLRQFGEQFSVRTDDSGVFRFDGLTPGAEYGLRIPADQLTPERHGVNFLGPASIWWVLGSAFGWAWMGLAVVVFRAGLVAVPRDLLRMARSFGAGRVRRTVAVALPALIPVTAVVLLTLLVAAARVFDLVLITAPGSVQDDVEVVGLHWWRRHDLLGDSGAAALAVLLLLGVATLALLVLWGLSRQWPTRPRQPEPRSEPERSAARRWLVRSLGTVAIAMWLLPFLVLLFTSLRSPHDAGRAGWWVPGEDGFFSLESYREAFASGELGHALIVTLMRSVAATFVLLCVAVLAAFALACGELSRRSRTVLVAIAAVLAVVPVQAVAGPLGSAFDTLRLSGRFTVLTLVHVALGLPFAVLLLRPVFAAVPHRELLRAQLGTVAALRTVVERCWPTVVAVAVLEFVLVWNDLVVGLILGRDSGSVTLVLLGLARQFTTASGVTAAAAVVSMLVPLALVLATGRWVVRGLTEGVVR